MEPVKAICPYCGASGYIQESKVHYKTLRYEYRCRTWALQLDYADKHAHVQRSCLCIERERTNSRSTKEESIVWNTL
jgi:hypothetical protein